MLAIDNGRTHRSAAAAAAAGERDQRGVSECVPYGSCAATAAAAGGETTFTNAELDLIH